MVLHEQNFSRHSPGCGWKGQPGKALFPPPAPLESGRWWVPPSWTHHPEDSGVAPLRPFREPHPHPQSQTPCSAHSPALSSWPLEERRRVAMETATTPTQAQKRSVKPALPSPLLNRANLGSSSSPGIMPSLLPLGSEAVRLDSHSLLSITVVLNPGCATGSPGKLTVMQIPMPSF